MSDTNINKEVVKKENKNFFLGVIAILLIALYSSNPTQLEFNEFISKEVRKKLTEKMGEQNIFGNLVAGFAGTLVSDVSSRQDYLIFSTYKVDLSVARMFGGEYSDLKFIGIGGQFIPLSGYSSSAPPKSPPPSVAAPEVSPTSQTYTSIYYASNAVKYFGWGVGFPSQSEADVAAEASCRKTVGGVDGCKKLVGGQYRCFAIYQNSKTSYAYIDNNLETAKQNAYTNCSNDTAVGDVCTLPEYGSSCAGN